MSGIVSSRSAPARLSARAALYHVSGKTGPGNGATDPKLANTEVAPALPRTPAPRESKEAWMKISTLLSRVEPQMSAACRKAMSRCSPSVVPVLPPTGAAGVGSLNPSDGPSTTTMLILAAPSLEGATSRNAESARRAGAKRRRVVIARLTSLRLR